MKKIYLIVFIMLAVLQLKAQYVRDKWGEVVPFSLTEKYKDVINTKEIHSLVLPSFDNDSLFFHYNNVKSYREVGSTFGYGFIIDSLINFEDYAKKIKIEEGTLWIMTIESPTALSIGIKINNFDIPKKAYFSIYPGTIPNVIQNAEVGFKENIDKTIKEKGFDFTADDKKVVIEFFVPNGIKAKPKYLINKIIYGFVGPGRPGQKIDYDNYKGSIDTPSNMLKSGGLTDTMALSCQKDVVCPEVQGWAQQAKSVVFVDIPFTFNGLQKRSLGTGFFINKVGGYSANDNPILITCGHLFAPKADGVNQYDISNNYGKIRLYIDYQNQACNETTTRYGKNIVGTFYNVNKLLLGSSFNNAATQFYHENEDYAILQPTKTIDKLSKYNIEYAGWTSTPNYNQEGYATIGHPVGDVKKVNIDNDYAPSLPDHFSVHFDIGVSEEGFSGSPIFNSSKIVVGWLCTGEGDCSTVGLISGNVTTCGRFDALHSSIALYVDSNYVGEAPSSNPQPPIPPAHCDDCIQNYDETAIDCGGADCYPCGMQDVITLKTLMDIPENSAKSRYELFAEPDPNTLLALKSGNNYSFEAGMNVHLNGGFEVEKGAEFYAGIDAELMSEPDRGCGGYCVNTANVFTPNGDGINDYWAFSQAFAIEYDLRIWDRNNQTIYSINGQPIYKNGGVIAWDGSGATQNTTYWGLLTLTDCNGNTHQEDFFVQIFGLKSAEIPEEKIATEIKNVATTNEKIEIYPNPFSDNIIINFSGGTFPLEYKVTDLNGKVVLHNKTSSNNETVNLSGLAAGTYVINVKAGDCNLVRKIIKE